MLFHYSSHLKIGGVILHANDSAISNSDLMEEPPAGSGMVRALPQARIVVYKKDPNILSLAVVRASAEASVRASVVSSVSVLGEEVAKGKNSRAPMDPVERTTMGDVRRIPQATLMGRKASGGGSALGAQNVVVNKKDLSVVDSVSNVSQQCFLLFFVFFF